MQFNEHIEGDGPTVFAHACKMGLEGIVSKRKDSAYCSGRSPDWLKMKNPEALAVKHSRPYVCITYCTSGVGSVSRRPTPLQRS